MTDSSSFHGSTTSSSDLNSHTMSKIRTIRLNRPHTGNKNNLNFGHPPFSSFGFSLRGGREYGTGFFVSNVVKGSEADLKGLQVGDQIVRVGGSTGNSYRVDDAVHRELSQFIINQDRLLLKVRGVGLFPIKETQSGNLTWHVVPLSSGFDHNDATQKEVQILLHIPPRTKLGCGICKGPDWKPGIFVQFTKENGIARESGLRPGDQILSCNGISFNDILFSEAVSIMKNSEVLELFVRTCVGLDLFPGESSGYNSSASSITGDQSPCWGVEAAKRLSIVREESTSSNDRLHSNCRFRDRRKEKPLPVGVPKIPKSHQNTTIIKLSQDGTMINNTMIPNVKSSATNSVYEEVSNQKDDDQNKIANICFVSKQNETKIVTVEVHRSSNIAPTQLANTKESSDKSPPEQSSLSSAISEELRRRAVKKLKQPSEVAQPQQSSTSDKTNSPKGGMGGQNHNILMDEFKKAHQKMFKNGFIENQHSNSNDRTAVDNVEERQLEKTEILKLSQNDPSPNIGNNTHTKKNLKELPMKKKASAPAPPIPMKKLEKQVSELDETTPPPDYDSPDNTLVKSNGDKAKGTLGRIAMQEAIKANGENAEALSMESFSLNNPTSKIPPPPPIFFSSQKSIPATMKKIQRPVSVIINSYDEKKDPGKFNFLEANGHGSLTKRNDEDMSTRLKKELEKTLSRSNLRRRSDSMDDLLKTEERGTGNILNIRNNLKKDLNNKLLQETQKNGLNGILKNGTTKSQTKNISFGEIKQ